MTKSNHNESFQKHPHLTPYMSHERYEQPKEDFKTIGRKLATLVDTEQQLRVADVGCGNGELLYYLHKQYPHWDLSGFDHTLEFIKTAQDFHGLQGVKFYHRDFTDIEGTYDIVLSTCFLSLFKDISEPFNRLLDLCTDGGYIFATGLFNPYDIEVRVEFCDNSRPETRGEWRTDFNRHSQQSIRRMLEGRVHQLYFIECRYDIELAPDPDHVIRVWSLREHNGNTLLINGAWQIANQTLLIV
nr:methyltransferase domain-containing protein [Gammaproteobacteria bacterium]NIO61276.1 methyltransferase domain-containing protein [Gammaproteobacteria bacterium]